LALFGDAKYKSGKVFKDSFEVCPKHPSDAIGMGIAYLPEDRKTEGLFMEQTVADNIISTRLQKGWFNAKENKRIGNDFIKMLNIRTPSVLQRIQQLSGGNQQKVVLAKWLHTDPDVLIVNEATHGVDVGAKADIYNDLKNLL
jgi:ribose transport system ATP-binding protein